VLIFDEPVNGLDPDGIRWARQLMQALAKQGRTVLVSSHLVTEMELTADRVVIIGRGQLINDSSRADLAARYATLEEAYLQLTAGSTDHRAQWPRTPGQ